MSQVREATPQEVNFHNWKQHKVTRDLFKKLREERLEVVDGIVYSKYEHEEIAKGIIQALDNLLSITVEDLYGPQSERDTPKPE